MELIISFAAVSAAILIGAISPGPSFVLVARTAMAVSRLDALFSALGMGVGAVMFAVLVLLGLQALLVSVPWLYLSLKVVGGVYLIYLAVRIWRGARETIVVAGDANALPTTAGKSFLLGFFTQVSNPKTAVVYGSFFAALLPHTMPTVAMLALPVLVFIIEAGWYGVVALALSSASSRTVYLNSKAHLDRAAGGVMGLLGLKLIATAKPAP